MRIAQYLIAFVCLCVAICLCYIAAAQAWQLLHYSPSRSVLNFELGSINLSGWRSVGILSGVGILLVGLGSFFVFWSCDTER